DLDQLSGSLYRRLLTSAQDRPGVTTGELLLPVVLEDPAEFAFPGRREDISGGAARRLVHPHVQRRVLGVREASLGDVQMQGGDSQIEKDAVDAVDAGGSEGAGDAVVHGVHESDPVAEALEPLPRK